jgi:Flp pilus assembly protein CpaB
MKRGPMFIIFAVLLIFGLLAMLVVWRFVLSPGQQSAEAPSATAIPQVEVLVVSQSISKGTEIKEDMLAAIPWQVNSLAPGMYKAENIADVIGSVAKMDISSSTPLLASMLLAPGETISESGSPWALSIPSGMVAVSIPMDTLSSVSYAPRAGDHVSVIVSMLFVDVDTDFQSSMPNKTGVVIASGPPDPERDKNNPLTVEIPAGYYGKTLIDPVLGQAVHVYPLENPRPRLVSSMLLSDVVVLQVGNFPMESETKSEAEATPTPTPEGDTATPVAPQLPQVITLIVTPQDAVTLNYIMLAQSQLAAQLSLALRGATDTTHDPTLPVTLGFLLEQYQIQVPAKLPYSLNPRIDALSPVLIATPTPAP